MAKVIIGIHGLDNKPPKHILEVWWKNAIVEGLNGIGKKCKLPKFEMVYWADAVYDKPLDLNVTDKEDSYYIEEVYTPTPLGFNIKPNKYKAKIVSTINKLARNFFLNHDLTMKHNGIADTVVERYFKEMDIYFKKPCNDPHCVSCKIRNQIVEKMVATLKQYQDDEIFLIGHSMGSVIGYDVLMHEIRDMKINTYVTIGSPLGLPYVLSKLAYKNPSNSTSVPVLKVPSSISYKWYNFSDIDDTVALNHILSGEFSKNEDGISPTDVLVRNNYMINDKRNPHKSFGYMRTPEFAKVLAAFIEKEKPSIFTKYIRKVRGFVNKG